jgi:hypothetical protein
MLSTRELRSHVCLLQNSVSRKRFGWGVVLADFWEQGSRFQRYDFAVNAARGVFGARRDYSVGVFLVFGWGTSRC